MIFEMENCGACRTCEMVCCFHHTGGFGPSPRSLSVLENPDGKGYLLSITEENENMFVACDCCNGLGTPQCVEICPEADVLWDFLNEYSKKTGIELAPSGEKGSSGI